MDTSQPRRMALRGLHHVTAISRDLERTTAFYRDVLGLALMAEARSEDDPDARHFWFGAEGSEGLGGAGSLISFLEYPDMDEGSVGAGSTHHFAFTVDSPEEQEAWRDYLRDRGVACTEVFDRAQFRSIYVRDPDGHIVELTTRGPGFTGPSGPGS